VGSRRGTGLLEPDRWLHLAVRYLARWDRTVAQVDHFLRNKGASPNQVKQTIGRLSDLRYLDDRAYAQRWIEHRLARKPMGRERLKAELQTKGVAESLAERAIRDALRGVDEETLARLALKIKQRRGGQLAPIKATRLLRQWGFEEETVRRIIGLRDATTGIDT
jgi:regulatory protein